MYTKKGFTLIELLVVILIIGILSGVVIVRNDEGNDVANDMKRKSDLEIIKDAAAAYRHMNFNQCPVLDCYIGAFRTPEEREKSIGYVMGSGLCDAVVIGFKSTSEIDEAIERIDRALAQV